MKVVVRNRSSLYKRVGDQTIPPQSASPVVELTQEQVNELAMDTDVSIEILRRRVLDSE